MTVFWLVAFAAFVVGEALTVGLVSIWFAIGALGGLAAAALHLSLPIQILVFLALSALSLLLFKPLSAKLIRPKAAPTNADRVLGRTALVTQTIDNSLAQGQVRVDGQIWSARAEQDLVIAQDREVRVLRIEGVKVIVQPV